MKLPFIMSMMFVTLSFMGCLGPEDKRTVIEEEDIEVTRLIVSDEELSQFPFSDNPIRNFTVITPSGLTERLWAVYGTELAEDHNYGGNCCEHYIATDQDGVIYNLGGEWPWWSTEED